MAHGRGSWGSHIDVSVRCSWNTAPAQSSWSIAGSLFPLAGTEDNRKMWAKRMRTVHLQWSCTAKWLQYSQCFHKIFFLVFLCLFVWLFSKNNHYFPKCLYVCFPKCLFSKMFVSLFPKIFTFPPFFSFSHFLYLPLQVFPPPHKKWWFMADCRSKIVFVTLYEK